MFQSTTMKSEVINAAQMVIINTMTVFGDQTVHITWRLNASMYVEDGPYGTILGESATEYEWELTSTIHQLKEVMVYRK